MAVKIKFLNTFLQKQLILNYLTFTCGNKERVHLDELSYGCQYGCYIVNPQYLLTINILTKSTYCTPKMSSPNFSCCFQNSLPTRSVTEIVNKLFQGDILSVNNHFFQSISQLLFFYTRFSFICETVALMVVADVRCQ